MNDLQPIADMIATTVENGGGTFEYGTYLPFRPAAGYAVAIGGVTIHTRDATLERVARLARDVTGEWSGNFVGTWIDRDVLYIDAVEYYGESRREAAIAAGRARGQLAIYDFAAQESITL